MEIVALAGRNDSSRGRALAREFGVSYVSSRAALVAARPAVVVEAASHDAVREHLVALLEAGNGGGGLSLRGPARWGLRPPPRGGGPRPRGAALVSPGRHRRSGGPQGGRPRRRA